MKKMTSKTVLGLFEERSNAEDAIERLKDNGYDPKDISIIMKDKREGEKIGKDTGADVVGGAVSGAATGTLLGGLAGLLASFVLPGLGAFFIGGPIAAALGLTGAAATTASGAATGALAGGLVGALTGFGLSENEARTYERRVKGGAILVAVPARMDEEGKVEEIFDNNNASDIKSVAQHEDHHVEEHEEEEYHHPHDRTMHTAGLKGGKIKRKERSRFS